MLVYGATGTHPEHGDLNMVLIAKNARFLHAGGLAMILLLCACEKAPEADVSAKDAKSLPPAIIPPAETADSAAPPSYEVGIASAAADRNGAKAKCAEKSERLRAICEAEADAAFTSAQSGLEDLRSNQQ
jgi:hypothetical protein